MLNPVALGRSLTRRIVDDLSAIGQAAREVRRIRAGVLGRLDTFSEQLECLRDDIAPLRQLGAVGEQLANVRVAVAPLADKLEAMRAEMRPIQELAQVRAELEAVRTAVEPLAHALDALRD